MVGFWLLVSIVLLLLGHAFRLLRWEQFITIYERPARGRLLRGMALGYGVDFVLPFHVGDILRAVYAGRGMKSGTGFAFATVIMDRFLDIWFVALGFGSFYLLGLGGAPVRWAAWFYLAAGALLVVALVLVVLLRDPLRRICLAFCSIFNEEIKLDGMVFFWSLINTFKDLARVHIGRLLGNTVLMWAAYLASYQALATALTACGSGFDLVQVFTLLFGADKLDLLACLQIAPTRVDAALVVLLVWYLAPVLCMWAAACLPDFARGAINQVFVGGSQKAAGDYVNLLPQADPRDKAEFLRQYFGLENKGYVAHFIRINEGVTILQDYSAGSNATTMLCMDADRTFYRKYAFGADGDKLAEQLAWLRRWQTALPLCEILRAESEPNSGVCWYDMAYSTDCVGLFRYLHSNPVQKSGAVLVDVLHTLQQKLYAPTARPADADKLARYIETKVQGNLQALRTARPLRELAAAETLWINGAEYDNLAALDWLFAPERLQTLFATDPVAAIHGDLTVENIICRNGGGWYLIDPNTGNLHDSPFLDYGKLLQSLHGSYEFMMKTPRVTVQGNHIDFALTRSAAYDALLQTVVDDLAAQYTPQQMQSIWMHEVIHWLRLMPYKLAKDRARAPMFYAGLVMVANDVARRAKGGTTPC